MDPSLAKREPMKLAVRAGLIHGAFQDQFQKRGCEKRAEQPNRRARAVTPAQLDAKKRQQQHAQFRSHQHGGDGHHPVERHRPPVEHPLRHGLIEPGQRAPMHGRAQDGERRQQQRRRSPDCSRRVLHQNPRTLANAPAAGQRLLEIASFAARVPRIMIEPTADNARFLSPEPEVKLVNSFARPFDNAMATARTCYSAKGIVTTEQVAALDESDAAKRAARLKKRDELAASLFQAGHHTVFQHAHFQFTLANVSRQFVWSFLHSHPFYNSEQVSQRYVKVEPDCCAVPPLAGEAREVYEETVRRQFDAYGRLNEMLLPLASREYFARFRARGHKAPLYEKDIRKKCMEVARYLLPVATFTCLYHTVSGITLLRYHRLMNLFDTPLEQRIVVGRMVEELLRFAPEYKAVLNEPIPVEETVEHQFLLSRRRADEEPLAPIAGTRPPLSPPARARQFREEFDRELGGRVSKLMDFKGQNEKTLADAVREVFGLMRHDLSDDDAIEWVMNPARNRYLGDEMNLTLCTKLTRAMV
ncbi:MAG: FAD-dependent thymidylate synthase, partial [Verrucomicrobia bacterium]|nr:FAD-dependent thymidylate synthase [Verrucomicrobiota bacterium]